MRRPSGRRSEKYSPNKPNLKRISHEKTHHIPAGALGAGSGQGRIVPLRDHPGAQGHRPGRRRVYAEKHHRPRGRGPGHAVSGGRRRFRRTGGADDRLQTPAGNGRLPQPHRPAADRRARRRSLSPDGRSRRGAGGGFLRPRRFLRHSDALSTASGGHLRRYACQGRALAGSLLPDRGRAPFSLPRDDARRRPLFHAEGDGQEVHRPDGHAQTEHVPLASDRRPGLAYRDQEIPAPDRSRCMAPRNGRLCGP